MVMLSQLWPIIVETPSWQAICKLNWPKRMKYSVSNYDDPRTEGGGEEYEEFLAKEEAINLISGLRVNPSCFNVNSPSPRYDVLGNDFLIPTDLSLIEGDVSTKLASSVVADLPTESALNTADMLFKSALKNADIPAEPSLEDSNKIAEVDSMSTEKECPKAKSEMTVDAKLPMKEMNELFSSPTYRNDSHLLDVLERFAVLMLNDLTNRNNQMEDLPREHYSRPIPLTDVELEFVELYDGPPGDVEIFFDDMEMFLFRDRSFSDAWKIHYVICRCAEPIARHARTLARKYTAYTEFRSAFSRRYSPFRDKGCALLNSIWNCKLGERELTVYLGELDSLFYRYEKASQHEMLDDDKIAYLLSGVPNEIAVEVEKRLHSLKPDERSNYEVVVEELKVIIEADLKLHRGNSYPLNDQRNSSTAYAADMNVPSSDQKFRSCLSGSSRFTNNWPVENMRREERFAEQSGGSEALPLHPCELKRQRKDQNQSSQKNAMIAKQHESAAEFGNGHCAFVKYCLPEAIGAEQQWNAEEMGDDIYSFMNYHLIEEEPLPEVEVTQANFGVNLESYSNHDGGNSKDYLSLEDVTNFSERSPLLEVELMSMKVGRINREGRHFKYEDVKMNKSVPPEGLPIIIEDDVERKKYSIAEDEVGIMKGKFLPEAELISANIDISFPTTSLNYDGHEIDEWSYLKELVEVIKDDDEISEYSSLQERPNIIEDDDETSESSSLREQPNIIEDDDEISEYSSLRERPNIIEDDDEISEYLSLQEQLNVTKNNGEIDGRTSLEISSDLTERWHLREVEVMPRIVVVNLEGNSECNEGKINEFTLQDLLNIAERKKLLKVQSMPVNIGVNIKRNDWKFEPGESFFPEDSSEFVREVDEKMNEYCSLNDLPHILEADKETNESLSLKDLPNITEVDGGVNEHPSLNIQPTTHRKDVVDDINDNCPLNEVNLAKGEQRSKVELTSRNVGIESESIASKVDDGEMKVYSSPEEIFSTHQTVWEGHARSHTGERLKYVSLKDVSPTYRIGVEDHTKRCSESSTPTSRRPPGKPPYVHRRYRLPRTRPRDPGRYSCLINNES